MARALEGRIALVTGASRGIGAAVARRLGAEGARVVLLARSEHAPAAIAKEIGGGAVSLACDVTDSGALQRALDSIPDLAGGVPDIVVNNAGAFRIAPVLETSVESFAETLAVNLTAPFAVVRALLPSMSESGRGHVVNIGSIADHMIFPGNAAYSASKFGLRALHGVLREELRKSGIRTTLISPGPVDTDIWNPIDPDNKPGFTRRAEMLSSESVAHAVLMAVTAPAELNIDEMKVSRA